jgi:L-aminopeptidase/D-esterase-like protein
VVAVNARGYTTMGDMPQFWAWALEQEREFGGLPPPAHGLSLSVSHSRADLTHDPADLARSDPRANTTIAVVATNARLDKASAQRLAMIAQDGLARSIRPVHTPQDGDTVFAVATGSRDRPTRSRSHPTGPLGPRRTTICRSRALAASTS